MIKIKENKNIVIGIGIILSFVLLTLSVSMYYDFQHEQLKSDRLTPEQIDSFSKEEIKSYIEEKRASETFIHGFYLIPFFAFIGLFVGIIVYYIMSERIKLKNTQLKNNTRIILNFLTPNERKIIELLMENHGKIPQYELTRLPGMTKVKTHRILENMQSKNIISKEKYGKINQVTLNKDLYNVLKE